MLIITTADPEYGGKVHTIQGVVFTGDIAKDVATMNENEELECWLWGELETADTITDGSTEYSGSDIQDHL